jgi:hypothetical protein
VLAFACQSVSVSAQDALSTRQREALASRAANKTTQRDLLSIFKPVGKIDSGMLRRLRGVGLQTRSFGTEFPNVCRRDTLSLRYAPAGDDGPPPSRPEDTPLAPYGVEADSVFHVIGKARPERASRDTAALVFQPACAAIGDEDGWFGAEDAFHALQGAVVFEQALDAVRAGKLKAKPCPDIFDPKKATCEQAINAVGDLSKLDSIASCPADEGTVCYDIDLASSTKLTITARGDQDSVAPGEILSIAIEQYIVVT